MMQVQADIEYNKYDNFEFLKQGLGELYNQATLAERYYFTDPQSSMVKIRLFVELACHELGKHFKLRPPVHGELSNKIKMLQSSGCIESWVIEEMNALRHDGNRSVHMTEVNGEYIAKLSISRSRMQKHMNALYEIAHYVGRTILDTPSQCSYTWQEPMSCELTSFVTDALKGCKEASFYLANHFYSELLDMSKQTGESRAWSKDEYYNKQTDVSYWLEKTHRQGHPQSWLLFAKCYSNKLLQQQGNRDAKYCFKQALTTDEEGEAAFEFGAHLIKNEEPKLGINHIHQAAKKGYSKAMSFALSNAFSSDSEKEQWLACALEQRLPEAFTVDTLTKLEAYETEQTDESLKALRSAIVAGQARRAPAMAFFKSYIDITVYQTQDTDKSIQEMVDSYKCMPHYLDVELRLFKQIANEKQHFSLMREIYKEALRQSVSELEEADVKYRLAKLALDVAADKSKVRSGVKTPSPIPTLLTEAADAGHAEARIYINSPEGKAVLKKIGYTTLGNSHKSGVDKQKNKRKRKLARKMRRK
ncbi:DUF4145 domain-containing protein [Vibrio sp. B1Z05]|uniref:DUF4145 domain-containing protein n=1 Tax=Vibrio sp. B1Z05 TaxID=2654980 RepID=UPI00128C9DFA|nr:DUF4145 domain-containing protein [Vibrio sp. B1Z05]MPW37853.1 DUF4145 domain-containing protein [Vibrio sp. B1Z05]